MTKITIKSKIVNWESESDSANFVPSPSLLVDNDKYTFHNSKINLDDIVIVADRDGSRVYRKTGSYEYLPK